MQTVYIHALLELFNSGTSVETALTNLKTVLKNRGHVRLLPAILGGLLAELEQAQIKSVPKVVLAKEGSVDVATIKKTLESLAAPTGNYQVTYNENIIGGLIATYNNRCLDQSYQTKLRELYQSIITA